MAQFSNVAHFVSVAVFSCYLGRLLSVTHFLRVTHFYHCMTYFSSDDPDTPVTYISKISQIFRARGRGYPKTLEKIWILYNRLNRGVQTHSKIASLLRALDRNVRLSQSSPIFGDDLSPWGKS